MQCLKEGGRGTLETSPQAKHHALSGDDVKAGETEGTRTSKDN